MREVVLVEDNNRESMLNTSPNTVSNHDIAKILLNHFLGNDWYVSDPLSADQINAIALDKILSRYTGARKQSKIDINIFNEWWTLERVEAPKAIIGYYNAETKKICIGRRLSKRKFRKTLIQYLIDILFKMAPTSDLKTFTERYLEGICKIIDRACKKMF